MTVVGRGHGRFSLERLLAPRSVLLLGQETPEGAIVAANLRTGRFAGRLMAIGADLPGFETYADIDALPEAPDLAVIACRGEAAGEALERLAARGTRAGVAITWIPDLAARAQAAGVRVLGSSSFGIAVPRLGLNASVAHMAPPPGRVALLTQSASLARAVLDWAGPNGVGFSHIVGVGGSADLGFSLALDWLSRDAGTGLILMDVRRIRDRRAFISAARAASRLRPVVAIRPGGRLLDPTGRADAVFAAALNRAGVFVVRQLEEFLAAAETLNRSRAARADGLAIVTNAIGPGRLAADAALEAGLKLAILPPEAQSALSATLPADLVYGLVYAGSAAPTHVAEIAAMLSAVPEVGGVLVLLAPTGVADAAATEALIAAASASRLPILACVMGETSGMAHRRRLAEAGIPAFATPEQAVRAFAHLLRDREARIAAQELPTRRTLDVVPDHARVAAVLGAARAAGRAELTAAEAAQVLAAYDLPAGPGTEACVPARLSVHDDPMFGPAIALAVAGGPAAYGLPPLNLALSHALARRAGVPEADQEAVCRLLVRLSQLLVDEPELGEMAMTLWLGACSAVHAAARIVLRPAGERAVLAILPYPEHLAGRYVAAGRDFVVRPIRPEDAEAHAAMIRRLPPEDLRYRFFSALREVSPEQMARLTQIDYDREMAFVAVRMSDQATVGVARLVREVDGPRGEFAIVVEPSVKGTGLATHLMRRLMDWAREQGLAEMTGTILAENHPMIGFARHLGFSIHRVPEEADLVEAVLQL